jgi:exonuclease SbcC
VLQHVRLTNFQRHRQLEVSFNSGLTAMRGANEAGKSTLLRAICYALFGVKGLGASLEDLVTWGEDVKTLKVELQLLVEDVVYVIKRGKSGAEIVYDGGTVTGQNEITAFCCRLLKCDVVSASRLILANQGDIRGALEAGPQKTTELIERLAEFDQIDNLIDTIQEKLTLGSTGPVEAAIAAAEKSLDDAKAAAVEPDLAMLDGYIEDCHVFVERGDKTLADQQADLEHAQQAFNDGKVAAAERAALDREVNELQGRIDRVEAELVELRKTPAPDNVDIPALRQRIEDADQFGAVLALHAKVEPYFRTKSDEKFAGGEFKGSIEELEEELKSTRTRELTNSRDADRCRTEAKLLRQQVTNGSCSFCGQDFSNVPEVQAKNAKLVEDAEAYESDAARLQKSADDERAEIQRLEGILRVSRGVLRILDVVGEQYAKLADDTLPPFLEWVGPDVTAEVEDVSALRALIEKAEREQRAFERASAKIETLDAERTRLYQDREAAYERRARGPHLVDLDALRAEVEAARDALRPARENAEAAKAALAAAQREKEDAVAAYERAKAAVQAAKETLKQRRAELDELEFNNALLKRVRQCRPMIADQLWNLVLSAVSTYFSEMRGVKSRVRKGPEGFTIDGRVVNGTSMSGSTLDILGLAIRVALVRTFMPMAPFFILDEPASACDDDRTSNMLGFLAGCGFQQVLLVTHEDTSEAVADNMITL